MIEILNKYYEDGLLYKQVHPELDLIIWNYTEKVQYERLWDDITIRCRGLITDFSGKIIVQPFRKFFNYEEVVDKNEIPWDSEYLYVQEKMDGSLGVLFHYMGRWIMATRGSFTSEQAIRGLEIVKTKYNLTDFNQSVAYLVEIIYPENRIVVEYGKDLVIFLSTVPNGSYEWPSKQIDVESGWYTSKRIFESNGIDPEDIVKTERFNVFGPKLYHELRARESLNKEGFVLRFFPSNYRVKIKFDEYVRLHKIMTSVSTTRIWGALSSGDSISEYLHDVPDEFYAKISEYALKLNRQYQYVEDEARFAFQQILSDFGGELPARKDYAERVKLRAKSLHPILFKMYEDKPYSEYIWKIIKPEFSKL